MKLNAYTLYDLKSGLFSMPIFMQNDPMALRAIRQYALEKGSPVNADPHDFIIYNVGTWDDNTGILTSDTAPRSLGPVNNLLTLRHDDTDGVL